MSSPVDSVALTLFWDNATIAGAITFTDTLQVRISGRRRIALPSERAPNQWGIGLGTNRAMLHDLDLRQLHVPAHGLVREHQDTVVVHDGRCVGVLERVLSRLWQLDLQGTGDSKIIVGVAVVELGDTLVHRSRETQFKVDSLRSADRVSLHLTIDDRPYVFAITANDLPHDGTARTIRSDVIIATNPPKTRWYSASWQSFKRGTLPGLVLLWKPSG